MTKPQAERLAPTQTEFEKIVPTFFAEYMVLQETIPYSFQHYVLNLAEC